MSDVLSNILCDILSSILSTGLHEWHLAVIWFDTPDVVGSGGVQRLHQL